MFRKKVKIMRELIRKTGVKELIAHGETEYKVSSKFFDRFDIKVGALVKEACVRAGKNGRLTLLEQDL